MSDLSITKATAYAVIGAEQARVTKAVAYAVLDSGNTQRITKAVAYAVLEDPRTVTISPSHGPASGGTAVTLSGNGWFGGDVSVTLGGSTVLAARSNASTLSFTTQPHSAGPVTISVTSGSITKTVAFTFDLVVVPAEGPDIGGTAVRIVGVAAGSPSFGGIPASGVAPWDWNSITCLTPAHAAGAVTVAVGSLSLSGGFTYTATGGETIADDSAPIFSIGTATSAAGLSQLSNLEIDLLAGQDLTINGVRIPFAVSAGVLRGAEMTVERLFMSDRDTPVGTMTVFSGRAEANASSSQGKITIESWASGLKSILIPRHNLASTCPNQFCDSVCGLSRSALTLSGSAAATGQRGLVQTTNEAMVAKGEAYWENAVLSVGVTTRTVRVASIDAGTLSLYLTSPLPTPLSGGASFSLLPDCPKTIAACAALGNMNPGGGLRFRGMLLPQDGPTMIGTSAVPSSLHFSMRFVSGLPWDRAMNPGGIYGSGFTENVWQTVALSEAAVAITGVTMSYTAGDPYIASMSWRWTSGSPGASIDVLLPVIDASILVAVTINYQIATYGIELAPVLGAVDLSIWGYAKVTLASGLSAGEKVTIAGSEFKAIDPASFPAMDQWLIGPTPDASAINLANAINNSITAGIKGIVYAQAGGSSVIITTMTNDVWVVASGAHIAGPATGQVDVLFGYGSKIKITAGTWPGTSWNLDGTYTGAGVAGSKVGFSDAVAVSGQWSVASLPSPYINATIQRVEG